MDDDRLPQLGRQLELRGEQGPLALARRVVAVIIEPGLPHRDDTIATEQISELVEPPGLGIRGLVRMDAQRGEDALVPFRDLERGPALLDARADRDDPVHSHAAGTLDQGLSRLLAPVEMRVRVDHDAAAFSMRSSSASTISGSSFLNSGRGSWSFWPGASSLGFHSPIHAS